MKSVLVTGIGGTRSIAVLKALRMSGLEYKIVGTDANYFNAGSFQCDTAYIVPFASDPAYLPKLEKIITDEKIEIIFATVEKEVQFLASKKQYLQDTYGVVVLVPDSKILETCFDKYKTQMFLQEAGLTHIPTIYDKNKAKIAAFAREQGLPLIRKPVFGYGSKGLSIIKDQASLDATEIDATYVLQKYIENSQSENFYNLELNEFTAEIFVNNDGSAAGGIILKRALRNGETVAGYLLKDDKILSYLTKVALATGIRGPVNLQFRIAGTEVYIFEINPLFSGTTAVRASLGFNSVQLAVDSFVDGKHQMIAQDKLSQKYFLRSFEETFIDPADLQKLNENKYFEKA